MAKEKYLRLDPDGDFSWITIDRDDFLGSLYDAIACDCVEHVNLKYGLECLVDESGLINGYQRFNPYASTLYAGYTSGAVLFGPVIFVRTGIGPSGEPEWLPIYPGQIRILEHRLNVDIPDPEVAE